MNATRPRSTRPASDASDLQVLKKKLASQLEYYFSRQNLVKDAYLLGQMDSDQYVPIRILANFNLIKKLTKDIKLITEVLKELPIVQVDEQGLRVRPSRQRCVIIIREIPETTSVDVVKNLFNSENCPRVISCEYAGNNSWYVTFENDEDAQKALMYIREDVKQFEGNPIMARMKALPILSRRQPVPDPVAQSVPSTETQPQAVTTTTYPNSYELTQTPPYNYATSPIGGSGNSGPTQYYYYEAVPPYTVYTHTGIPVNSRILNHNYTYQNNSAGASAQTTYSLLPAADLQTQPHCNLMMPTAGSDIYNNIWTEQTNWAYPSYPAYQNPCPYYCAVPTYMPEPTEMPVTVTAGQGAAPSTNQTPQKSTVEQQQSAHAIPSEPQAQEPVESKPKKHIRQSKPCLEKYCSSLSAVSSSDNSEWEMPQQRAKNFRHKSQRQHAESSNHLQQRSGDDYKGNQLASSTSVNHHHHLRRHHLYLHFPQEQDARAVQIVNSWIGSHQEKNKMKNLEKKEKTKKETVPEQQPTPQHTQPTLRQQPPQQKSQQSQKQQIPLHQRQQPIQKSKQKPQKSPKQKPQQSQKQLLNEPQHLSYQNGEQQTRSNHGSNSSIETRQNNNTKKNYERRETITKEAIPENIGKKANTPTTTPTNRTTAKGNAPANTNKNKNTKKGPPKDQKQNKKAQQQKQMATTSKNSNATLETTTKTTSTHKKRKMCAKTTTATTSVGASTTPTIQPYANAPNLNYQYPHATCNYSSYQRRQQQQVQLGNQQTIRVQQQQQQRFFRMHRKPEHVGYMMPTHEMQQQQLPPALPAPRPAYQYRQQHPKPKSNPKQPKPPPVP